MKLKSSTGASQSKQCQTLDSHASSFHYSHTSVFHIASCGSLGTRLSRVWMHAGEQSMTSIYCKSRDGGICCTTVLLVLTKPQGRLHKRYYFCIQLDDKPRVTSTVHNCQGPKYTYSSTYPTPPLSPVSKCDCPNMVCSAANEIFQPTHSSRYMFPWFQTQRAVCQFHCQIRKDRQLVAMVINQEVYSLHRKDMAAFTDHTQQTDPETLRFTVDWSDSVLYQENGC